MHAAKKSFGGGSQKNRSSGGGSKKNITSGGGSKQKTHVTHLKTITVAEETIAKDGSWSTVEREFAESLRKELISGHACLICEVLESTMDELEDHCDLVKSLWVAAVEGASNLAASTSRYTCPLRYLSSVATSLCRYAWTLGSFNDSSTFFGHQNTPWGTEFIMKLPPTPDKD
ncbi:hypothetical protein F2Q70_00045018 [Brassica cretica]|uniref:Uncharacterized protein n=1 Tax=Brassica cretica TaxID=69181 RepID=A0A8S9KN60_BRACR|nr:hypothetical protein F2Q70_00045018 [Brassica cretica]